MKKIIFSFALFSAFSAQSASLEVNKCFSNKDRDDKRILSQIVIKNNVVTMFWDTKSNSRVDIERGLIMDLQQSQDLSKSRFQTYLANNASDGSLYSIEIKDKTITIQALWSDGKPAAHPSVHNFVKCR